MLKELDKVRDLFDVMAIKSHNLNNLLMRIQFKIFSKKIRDDEFDMSELVKSEIDNEMRSIDRCVYELEEDKLILKEILRRLE